MPQRELNLVQQAKSCDTNYFNRDLLTWGQRVEGGSNYCPNVPECTPNVPECTAKSSHCALKYGTMVAGYVLKGGTLRGELYDFFNDASNEGFINEEFWTSDDRTVFRKEKEKGKLLKAVERFARVILLENPGESVFPSCERCDGVRLETTVIDSGREGVGNLSGSGKTRRRTVSYCPDCEPKTRDGTFEENLVDELF